MLIRLHVNVEHNPHKLKNLNIVTFSKSLLSLYDKRFK